MHHPGLERELTGLKVGDKRPSWLTVDGYDERMDDSIVELERSLFDRIRTSIGNSLNLG